MERGWLLGGRYRLKEELGHGGMSVVWRAHDEVLDREVAVKVLAPKLAGDAALLDRIRTEARAAACICHPYIVNVHDYGEASFGADPPSPYVVMEIVEGTSLADALMHGPLVWRVAVRTCAEVAAALAVAHARGIVHRDVTPRNIMLTPSGAKLVDFGISAAVGEADIGPGGVLLGTPAYLAPERLDGGSVQPATDVYALGLLLYKSLTGRLPWQSTTSTQMLAAHRYVDPAPLPPVPGLPPQVVDVCRRCLAKRPGDRPTSAEVAAVLAPLSVGPEAVGGARSVGRAQVPVASRAPAPTSAAAPPAPPAPGAAAVTPAAVPEIPTTALAGASTVAPGTGTSSTVVRTQHARWLPRRPRAAAAAAGAVGVLVLMLSPGVHGGPATESTGGRPQAAAHGNALPALPVECEAQIEVRGEWAGGFAAEVTVINTGPTPIDEWRLDFVFPGDQQVLRGSPGTWQQSDRVVAVSGGTPESLPPGESAQLTFEVAANSTNPLPSVFRVNGSQCTPGSGGSAGD